MYLEGHLGPHLRLGFMDNFSIGFSMLETGGKGQLYKFRHAVLLKMFYGVQDILIQVTDTTQDLQKILCRISLLQDGKSLL